MATSAPSPRYVESSRPARKCAVGTASPCSYPTATHCLDTQLGAITCKSAMPTPTPTPAPADRQIIARAGHPVTPCFLQRRHHPCFPFALSHIPLRATNGFALRLCCSLRGPSARANAPAVLGVARISIAADGGREKKESKKPAEQSDCVALQRADPNDTVGCARVESSRPPAPEGLSRYPAL